MTFAVRYNDDGTLDEVVGYGPVHLEQMANGHWWIGFGDREGLHVHLRARGTIKATVLCDSDTLARDHAPDAGAGG